MQLVKCNMFDQGIETWALYKLPHLWIRKHKKKKKKKENSRSTDILERTEREPNFSNDIVTGDESWVFQYDPETERHLPVDNKPVSLAEDSQNIMLQSEDTVDCVCDITS